MDVATKQSIVTYQMIHNAMKNRHLLEMTGKEGILPTLFLTQQKLAKIDDSPIALRNAINRVLHDCLEALEQLDNDGATLIRSRFIDRLSHEDVANQADRNPGSQIVEQRNIFKEMAKLLNKQEKKAREEEKARLLKSLSHLRRNALVGVDHLIAELVERLLDPDSKDLVIISGMGGIGKTSLVETAVFTIIDHFFYHNIVWVIVDNDKVTNQTLKLTDIQREIIEQIGEKEWLQLSSNLQQQNLFNRLRANRYLVVIDNIETAVDQELLNVFDKWAGPSRFLLTSRPTILHPDAIKLKELTLDATIQLIKTQIDQDKSLPKAQLNEALLSEIFEVVGGNPFAIRLAVGLLHKRPIAIILDDLKTAKSEKIQQDLYIHIYWRIWEEIEKSSRTLLKVMFTADEKGFTIKDLELFSGLPTGALWDAIDELVGRSILEKSHDLENPRYSIHRLTASFLQTEIINWPTKDDDNANGN